MPKYSSLPTPLPVAKGQPTLKLWPASVDTHSFLSCLKRVSGQILEDRWTCGHTYSHNSLSQLIFLRHSYLLSDLSVQHSKARKRVLKVDPRVPRVMMSIQSVVSKLFAPCGLFGRSFPLLRPEDIHSAGHRTATEQFKIKDYTSASEATRRKVSQAVHGCSGKEYAWLYFKRKTQGREAS